MKAKSGLSSAIQGVKRRASALKAGARSVIAAGGLKLRKRRLLNPESDIVITLTTYAARLGRFGLVLESLMRQKIERSYGIVVHLSAEDLPDGRLPPHLEAYRRAGVVFHVHSENLRSYKKLVYEYAKSAERILVTADDDIIYPGYWLRELVRVSGVHPGCIVAYRAHFLSLVGEREFGPYSEMMIAGREDGSRLVPRFDLMPTGVSGVLYPPGSLSPISIDASMYMAYAPTADDIWFKLASLLAATPCVQVQRRNRHFASIPGSQDSALYLQNVGLSRNDAQLAACFELFPALFEMIRKPHPTSGSDRVA